MWCYSPCSVAILHLDFTTSKPMCRPTLAHPNLTQFPMLAELNHCVTKVPKVERKCKSIVVVLGIDFLCYLTINLCCKLCIIVLFCVNVWTSQIALALHSQIIFVLSCLRRFCVVCFGRHLQLKQVSKSHQTNMYLYSDKLTSLESVNAYHPVITAIL